MDVIYLDFRTTAQASVPSRGYWKGVGGSKLGEALISSFSRDNMLPDLLFPFSSGSWEGEGENWVKQRPCAEAWGQDGGAPTARQAKCHAKTEKTLGWPGGNGPEVWVRSAGVQFQIPQRTAQLSPREAF